MLTGPTSATFPVWFNMMKILSGLRQGPLLLALVIAGVSSQAFGADRIAKAVFIEPPKGAPDVVYFVAPEKEAIEVALPSRTFSPDVELPAGDLVFAVLPRALGEGDAIPEGAPMVKIPKAWSRCYLLFTFQKDNKVFPIKVHPIDGSLNEFPPGQSRIVNLSPAMVRGKFGDEVVQVRPGGIENLEAPMKDFGAYPVAIDFLMKGDKKSQPLTRTSWQHNPRSRQVVLVTKPAGVKYPRIRALQDRVKVEE